MSKVTIKKVRGKFDLYQHYPWHTDRQDVYLWLDCREREVAADYDTGGGVTMPVWYGHTRRWRIPLLTSNAANDLMEELLDLFERVVDGYSCDGYPCLANKYAKYDEDALAAMEKIDEIISDRKWQEEEQILLIDSAEYLPYGCEKLSAGTSGEDLEIYANEIRDNVKAQFGENALIDDLESHLKYLRKQMQEEKE